MIRSLYRSQEGRLKTDLKPEEFAAALQDGEGLLWVDLLDEPVDVCEPILRQTFGFHPLAVDDALEESHVPKVDDWGQYVYVVLHAIVFDDQDGGRVDTQELDLFLGSNYLVTYHEQPIAAVDHTWASVQRDERHLRKGPDHLAYRLADELVAGYMPVVEQIDVAIEQLEDEVFEKPTSETLARIFALKRALLHLRRIITPQREVLNKLARDDYAVIDIEARPFFRDVYDHLVRLHDINESLRDLVSGVLDTYLSVINNRMNEIMKTLTIITALFMPISFIAGFFGMNFFQPVIPMEAWTGRMAFTLMWILTVLTPISMYLWMRRRGWM